eukprot:scaffold239_cov62-Cyclotella_meneghiniana.AAC.4
MQQLGLRTFRCHLTPLRPVSMRVETSADRLYDLILKGTRTGGILVESLNRSPVESLNRSDTGSIVLISGFSCAEFRSEKVVGFQPNRWIGSALRETSDVRQDGSK